MARPRRILVRSWLPGRGCVHFRSETLLEPDARRLLEAARGAIDKAQESEEIEPIPVAKGRAFVQACRFPDPDHPNRTAPGFVLVSIPESELDELIRSAAKIILDDIPPLRQEEDLEMRDLKPLDLGGPTSASRDAARSSNRTRWTLVAVAMLIVLVVLGVFPVLWLSRGTATSGDNPSPSRASQPEEVPDPYAGTWEQARQKIQALLDEPWTAKILREKGETHLADRDLLVRFARLFRKPDLDLGDGNKDYESRNPPDHPFVAFLSRLPATIPAMPEGKPDLTATEAMGYLKTLVKTLNDSGIRLDLDDLDRFHDQAKLSLDYEDFFGVWKGEHPDSADLFVTATMWDREREKDPAYHWLKPVRELIQARYSRR